MLESLKCPFKINLTLRIFEQRQDGFHDIFSIFWKKIGKEGLTIRAIIEENIADILDVEGAEVKGPNIVTQTLEWARCKGVRIPPLSLGLRKYYPQGSGIGAGSGNAAALIDWLRKEYALSAGLREISALGADVAFLAQDTELAFVKGKGETIEPLQECLDLYAVLAFPKWTSNTAEAYKSLDARRRDGSSRAVGAAEAEREAREVLETLMRKDFVGCLPNDFYDLFREKREYQEAFAAAEQQGAVAWGLCGSGSALFALCASEEDARNLELAYQAKNWIQKIDRVE